MTKGSDLLVAALENEGVERVFGVPGEENLDVVESLRGSAIKLILTRHEQAAAFMAATYRRLYPDATPAERLNSTLTDSNFRIRSLAFAERKAAKGRKVHRITLEIDKLSGVLPDAIAFCFPDRGRH